MLINSGMVHSSVHSLVTRIRSPPQPASHVDSLFQDLSCVCNASIPLAGMGRIFVTTSETLGTASVCTVICARLRSHVHLPTGADSKSGSIFCAECDDFVHDSAFASVLSSTSTAAFERFVPSKLPFTVSPPCIYAAQPTRFGESTSSLGYQIAKIPKHLRVQNPSHVKASGQP